MALAHMGLETKDLQLFLELTKQTLANALSRRVTQNDEAIAKALDIPLGWMIDGTPPGPHWYVLEMSTEAVRALADHSAALREHAAAITRAAEPKTPYGSAETTTVAATPILRDASEPVAVSARRPRRYAPKLPSGG